MHTKKILIFVFLLTAGVILSAQTGTLKIFSEIKDITIYIDEVYVGRDMAEIKNVQKGSHYLKIKKDNIVIHDQIINIEEGSTSTIVLKDTPAIQEKMLESMKSEIAQYDSLKLSFDQNMNFYKGGRSISLTEFARTIGNFDIEKRIEQDKKLPTFSVELAARHSLRG
ncbi:MAG: PEGA domain-containing protein [bacterium]|nr:PEGA domain-containing protein [bacterium]